MLDDLGADDGIEQVLVRLREDVLFGNEDLEPHLGVRSGGNADRALTRIDADNREAARGDPPCDEAVAATHVEDPRAGREIPEKANNQGRR